MEFQVKKMPRVNERELNIVDYMAWANIPYRVSGKWAWPVEHDSMRVHIDKNYFHRYSTDTWGHLREFIQAYYPDYSTEMVTKTVDEFAASAGKAEIKRSEIERKQEKFSWSALQIKSKLNTQALTFLAKVRGFNALTIAELQKQKLVVVGQRNNLYFPWVNKENKVVGADVQGTTLTKTSKRPYFKGVVGGSQHAHGWSMLSAPGKCDRAVVFEGPLDAIAYYQMNRAELTKTPALLISLGGVEKLDVLATALNEHLTPTGGHLKQLDLALDNDESGRGAVQTLKEKGLHSNELTRVSVLIPQVGKDWNEQLLRQGVGAKEVAIADFNQAVSDPETTRPKPPTMADTAVKQPVTTPFWPRLSDLEHFVTENRNLLPRFSLDEVQAIDKIIPTSERTFVATRQELRRMHLYPKDDVAKMQLDRKSGKTSLFTLDCFQEYQWHGKAQDMRIVADKRFRNLNSGWRVGRQVAYETFRTTVAKTLVPAEGGTREAVEVLGQHLARTTLNLSPRETIAPFHFTVRQAALLDWSKLSGQQKQQVMTQSQTYAQRLIDATKNQLDRSHDVKPELTKTVTRGR